MLLETSNQFFVFNEEIRRDIACRAATPFKNCIGQDNAVDRLLDLVYQAYSNEYHLVQENVMLAGPPSVGKTMLAKMLAKVLQTPSVFTDSNQLNGGIDIGGNKIPAGADTIIQLICDSWTNIDPLQGIQIGSFIKYNVPPMTIFIDEIHGLKRKTADALLKATERSDGIILGRNAIMDCKNVLWMGATTDWGKLPAAFRTRFDRIDLVAPTQDEVIRIIKLNNPDFSIETCKKIVFYGSLVPRETLAFARSVKRYADRMGISPDDCIQEAAFREGIDKWGMRLKRVEILIALKNAPKGLNLRNLSVSLACESEEVVRHWLPPLLFSKPSLVSFDRIIYSITDTGCEELKKRGL